MKAALKVLIPAEDQITNELAAKSQPALHFSYSSFNLFITTVLMKFHRRAFLFIDVEFLKKKPKNT